jgi:hypothetical protein
VYGACPDNKVERRADFQKIHSLFHFFLHSPRTAKWPLMSRFHFSLLRSTLSYPPAPYACLRPGQIGAFPYLVPATFRVVLSHCHSSPYSVFLACYRPSNGMCPALPETYDLRGCSSVVGEPANLQCFLEFYVRKWAYAQYPMGINVPARNRYDKQYVGTGTE